MTDNHLKGGAPYGCVFKSSSVYIISKTLISKMRRHQGCLLVLKIFFEFEPFNTGHR